MLCSKCSDIFSNIFLKDGDMFPHHAAFADLGEAASLGCKICFAFWNQYSGAQQSRLCQIRPGRGPCTSYWFQKSSNNDSSGLPESLLWFDGRGMARVTVSEESKTGPFSRESISSDVENADETIVVWVYWDMPKKSIGMAGRDAYVASAGFREEVDGPQGYGLLLRRVEDGEQAGTYARCAYYQTSPLPGEGRKTVELLREAFKETAEIPCVRCEGAQRVIWVV